MKVEKIITNEILRTFSTKEQKIGREILQKNMGLKPSESLLIVTDPKMEKNEAAIWFEAGKTITSKAKMVVFSGMTENAQEPPQQVSQLMQNADVILLQTTFSLSHTIARRNACYNGSRVASLPGVSKDIIYRVLDMDYEPVKILSEKLVPLLTNAETAHVTSKNGTDLTMSLKERVAIADTGFLTNKHDFGNLPAGETMLAPLENTTEGVFVVDGSFAGVILDSPISITVTNGQAVNISGKKAAQILTKQVDQIGTDARNIGELGIGTNPNANPKGSLIEAEKAYGTVHVALGNNMSYGGKINVHFHSDGVILFPTLTLDSKTIINNGIFQI